MSDTVISIGTACRVNAVPSYEDLEDCGILDEVEENFKVRLEVGKDLVAFVKNDEDFYVTGNIIRADKDCFDALLYLNDKKKISLVSEPVDFMSIWYNGSDCPIYNMTFEELSESFIGV